MDGSVSVRGGLERNVLWVEGKWEVEGCGRWRYVGVVRLRGGGERM